MIQSQMETCMELQLYIFFFRTHHSNHVPPSLSPGTIFRASVDDETQAVAHQDSSLLRRCRNIGNRPVESHREGCSGKTSVSYIHSVPSHGSKMGR